MKVSVKMFRLHFLIVLPSVPNQRRVTFDLTDHRFTVGTLESGGGTARRRSSDQENKENEPSRSSTTKTREVSERLRTRNLDAVSVGGLLLE